MRQLLEDHVNAVHLIYSDEGPDHHLTYHSVQLSLISLFLELKIDMLITGRTAPMHSWANPVEHLMSVLSLVYQNFDYSTEFCGGETEHKLKSCTGMANTCKLCEKNKRVCEKWLISIHPMIEVLNHRFKQVSLKGKQFQFANPASNEEVGKAEDVVITKIFMVFLKSIVDIIHFKSVNSKMQTVVLWWKVNLFARSFLVRIYLQEHKLPKFCW